VAIMLARTTTVHALLAAYPFLTAFLADRDEVLARLRDPASAGRWARVVTLGEVAVEMDVPWLDLLRQIQAEVRRVTGVAPPIAGAGSPDEADFGDDVRGVIRDLERGAPIAVLAARLDELTKGMDADAVAALLEEPAAASAAALAAGRQSARATEVPGAHAALRPGHPIVALERECGRLSGLADLVEEVVDGLGDPPEAARLDDARAPLLALLERLRELDRQARRLRLAWYTTLGSRVGPSVAALVAQRLAEALDGVARMRLAVCGEDAAAVVTQAHAGLALVRRALAAEEELLVPAASRALDDDDWEAVAEQERAIGWALDSGQAL
jgi:hypothetical protein